MAYSPRGTLGHYQEQFIDAQIASNKYMLQKDIRLINRKLQKLYDKDALNEKEQEALDVLHIELRYTKMQLGAFEEIRK